MIDTVEVVCPSGLTGVVRNLKTKEIKLFTSGGGNIKAHKAMDTLLTNCWIETTDAGPYTFDGDKPDWGKVLGGDRYYILLKIREATYGSEYTFPFTCEHCGAKNDFTTDFTNLEVQPLGNSGLASFLDGQALVIEQGSAVITYVLQSGDTELKASKLTSQNKASNIACALASKTTHIKDGDKNVDLVHFPAWYDDLSIKHTIAIAHKMQEHDCGVETSITVNCTSCGTDSDVELPITEGFWVAGQL